MIRCPSCGKELADGSTFCDDCGTRIPEQQTVGTIFCPNCGTQNSADSAFCQSCGTSLREESSAETSKKPTKMKPIFSDAAGGIATKKRKPILFGAIGIVAVILIVFIVSQFAGGGSGSSDYALYIKEGEIYYTNFSKNGPIEVTSRLDSNNVLSDYSDMEYGSDLKVILCDDGKTLFYPDRWDRGEFSLYYRNIKKPSEEPTRIDTGITTYSVTDKGDQVFYLKGGILYKNDKKDNKEKIANDVLNFTINDDGSKVAYQDEDFGLYIWDGGQKEQIASDIDYVTKYGDNLSAIYYFKENAIYKYTSSGSEKLISNAESLVHIYDTGEIYYITAEEEVLKLVDYINDDKLASDAAMITPERPTSPNRPYSYRYDTDAEYEAAQAQYEIDYAAYQAAYEQYQTDTQEYRNKQTRDNLRNSLKSETINRTVYSLYYFDGSDSTLVSDAVSNAYGHSYAYDKPVVAVRLNEQEEINKVRLSDISSVSEASSRVSEALETASEYHIVVGTNISSVGQENISNFFFAEDGSKIYFVADLDSNYRSGDLYQITNNNGQVGSPSLYDTDVVNYSIGIMNDGNAYYIKDINDRDEGELYVNKKSIAFDVSRYSISYNDDLNALFYYTDYNTERGDGTLTMYKNNTSTAISDDVYDYSVINGDDILYLYDYSSRSRGGSLYLYSGKTAEKIDDDVSAIVRFYGTERRVGYLGW